MNTVLKPQLKKQPLPQPGKTALFRVVQELRMI
jgi:hypothetical protein